MSGFEDARVEETLAVARAVIIIPATTTEIVPRVALFQRQIFSKNNGGLWECPGGQLDSEERRLNRAAAFGVARHREIFEETGLDVKRILPNIFDHRIDWFTREGSRCVTEFSLMQAVGGTIELREKEHQDYVLVDYRSALDYDLTPHSREALERYGEEILYLAGE